MVDLKRSSRGGKGFLNPQTKAALDSVPPVGYKSPQTLIGFKTIDPALIALRVKNYNRAYKTLSASVWNSYVAFGIQDFVGPDEYQMTIANESNDAKNLRVARYYRKLLENRAKIDSFLLQSMPAVENELAISHPGFFDKSLKEMDSFLNPLPLNATDPMDMEIQQSSLATAAAKKNDTIDNESSLLDSAPLPVTQEFHSKGASSPHANDPPLSQAEGHGFTTVRHNKTSTKPGSTSQSSKPKVSPDAPVAPLDSATVPVLVPVSVPVPVDTHRKGKRPTKVKNVI